MTATSSGHILVVDDEELNCSVLKKIFSDAGYAVTVAQSAKETFEVLDQTVPDLTLLDVLLGAENGMDVLSKIKEEPRFKYMCVVLITGTLKAPDQQAHGLEIGADGYLTRPIDNREILAKVNAFMRHKKAIDALQESEARFRKIIDHNPDAILIVDGNGRIRFANPASEELFQLTMDDLLCRFFGFPIINGEHTEIEIVRNSADVVIAEMRNINIEWEGEPCSLASIRNVSYRKNLEKQLLQKHKMEAVGLLAGGMAHNFNNNLSVILGNLELLKRRNQLSEGAQSFIQNAITGALQSRDLIQQIMSYSRADAQNVVSTQLSLVVRQTQKLILSTIPASVKLQIQATPESHKVKVFADATRIQEALLNLCNNAVQAMEEKGQLTIGLRTIVLNQEDILTQYKNCLTGDFIVLSVKDTGCGMSKDILDKIFDPFFTTKEVGKGTGMGLATVQGMIVQIGGQIKVKSTPGEGTTFELYFPICDVEESPFTDLPSQALPEGSERILFVDDNEMLTKLSDQMLTELGYKVTALTCSTEALKLFSANSDAFDLVITDQTMPGLLGSDLIKEIHRIKPDLPCILCTGYNSKFSNENSDELGITALIMKPAEQTLIAQTIRRVFDSNAN